MTLQDSNERKLKELSLLFDISQALDQSMDIREALADHMGMSRGTLTLLNRKTGEIAIEVAHGLSPSQRRRGKCRLCEGITEHIMGLRVDKYEIDPRRFKSKDRK